MYLRARYYDPYLGRFISEDTAKDGYNWYVYCGNDPVNRVDPSGNIALIASLLIGVGIGLVSRYANDVISNYQSGLKGIKAWSPSSSAFEYAISGMVGGIMGILGADVPWASLGFSEAVAMGGFMGIVGQTLYSFGTGNIPNPQELTFAGLFGMATSAVSYMIVGIGANTEFRFTNNKAAAITLADKTGGIVTELRNGYKVTLNTPKGRVVVRFMDVGSGGRANPYYRISLEGKGAHTAEGLLSNDRALTHIDTTNSCIDEILSIIDKLGGAYGG